ncbi:MAG: hypothetical protein AVDCRST_MAG59-3606 [uncultured Thermomicrobiales bacterium]|uniref:Uncharacterized protein n=1 Tax=uncultured Thermomicrobiales bacterium TaxID=1645740 RepID=A0A6J4VAQ4_9BACT|nr:MAG: hypothetical protein AVDCRST_MAG59-3606 [uncultured Thermomicrobiales bacterium]
MSATDGRQPACAANPFACPTLISILEDGQIADPP